MVRRAVLSREAQRALRRVPDYIADKLLGGTRQGQRSIRLSKAYRAIYTLRSAEAGAVAIVEEVSKHDY